MPHALLPGLCVVLVLTACGPLPSRPVLPTEQPGGVEGACAAPSMRLVADDEMYVVAVETGGPAAAAGVLPGDLLVALEGVPFAGNAAAIRQRLSEQLVTCSDVIAVDEQGVEHRGPAPTIVPVLLTVERGGQRLALTVDLNLAPSYLSTPSPIEGGSTYF